MKLGSLFDGSGGFPLAGSLCGIEPVWASEVEPYPIAVTKSRFHDMKHLGSVTDVHGGDIEPVDIITFGSPCQDLSVAGKRAGLKHEANGDDETTRSGLFMEAVRIIKEMRKATNGEYPTFAVWENVPGAFSSNKGEDFRTVLEELIKIVEPTAVMPAVPKNGWPYHVRDTFHRLENNGIKCTVDKHVQPDGSRITMWNLIPRKLIPPTRVVRYCCAVLKEGGGKDRFISTGVRWDESSARKKNRGALEVIASKKDNSLILSNDNSEDRRLFESCQLKGKRVVNPIVDWKTDDVLEYIESEHIPMNPLYGCGFSRVGCIRCPMASKAGREAEFAMFPKFKAAYIRAFARMMEERERRGKTANGMRWGHNGVDVFHWWMEDGVMPGQEVLDGFE